MKRIKLLAVLFFAVCMAVSAEVAHAAGKLMAGTAKVVITPPTPRRTVNDPLYARSLILESDGTRIAFISLDLGGYTNPTLLETLKKKYNLTELFFCPSHNHSSETGPREFMEQQLDKVMGDASRGMFEAKISGGWRYFPQLSFNRLVVRDDGHAREAWYSDPNGHYRYGNAERIPFGDVDPSVGMIRLDDMQGNPRVLMMNYACHPDALVAIPSLTSAEYVGFATKYTEEAFDNKVNCLFVQGGAGNQGSLFKTPTNGETPEAFLAMIERMGTLLGIEAVKLARELYPSPYDDASIKLMTDSIKMPNRFDPNIANAHFSTIIINGHYAIATFPGEPFIKFQLDWKREMGKVAVVPFFFGYTWNGGDWPTYVPDVRSAALGGYGADWGPVRAPESGEALMNRHLLNYYKISGLYRTTQGPGDHRLDNGRVIWTPDWMR